LLDFAVHHRAVKPRFVLTNPKLEHAAEPAVSAPSLRAVTYSSPHLSRNEAVGIVDMNRQTLDQNYGSGGRTCYK
jgi:hypothetical protein